MQLYILRHGEAERLSSTDRRRQLTQQGHEEVAAVVQRHLEELETVQTIWASPYSRAQQTAAVVQRQLPNVSLKT